MSDNVLTLRRAAKINLGNYENTDVAVELSIDVGAFATTKLAYEALSAEVNDLLRQEIDRIELGQVKSKSKAQRFGV